VCRVHPDLGALIALLWHGSDEETLTFHVDAGVIDAPG
jgi:hypothetical protein